MCLLSCSLADRGSFIRLAWPPQQWELGDGPPAQRLAMGVHSWHMSARSARRWAMSHPPKSISLRETVAGSICFASIGTADG